MPFFRPFVHGTFAQDVTTTAGICFILSSSFAFGTLLGEFLSKKTPFESAVTTKMGSMDSKLSSINSNVASIESKMSSIDSKMDSALSALAAKKD